MITCTFPGHSAPDRLELTWHDMSCTPCHHLSRVNPFSVNLLTSGKFGFMGDTLWDGCGIPKVMIAKWDSSSKTSCKMKTISFCFVTIEIKVLLLVGDPSFAKGKTSELEGPVMVFIKLFDCNVFPLFWSAGVTFNFFSTTWSAGVTFNFFSTAWSASIALNFFQLLGLLVLPSISFQLLGLLVWPQFFFWFLGCYFDCVIFISF